MHFEGTVQINAPRDKVWAFVIDPNQVGQCGPGVESIEVIDDSHFKATAKVGIGFISARFNVNMEFVDLERAECGEHQGPWPGAGECRRRRRADAAVRWRRRRDDDGLVGRRQHLGHDRQRRRAPHRGHGQQDDRADIRLHALEARGRRLTTSSPADRPLWRCPKCGHAFVGANMAHSCVTVDLDDVFARSTTEARAAFDAYVAMIGRCGPIEVIGQKTRIVIMGRVRFAGATVLRDSVRLNIALTRQIDAPWVEKIETYLDGRWNAHRFRVRSPRSWPRSLVCPNWYARAIATSACKGRFADGAAAPGHRPLGDQRPRAGRPAFARGDRDRHRDAVPGLDRRRARRRDWTLKLIVSSHGHWDHIGDNAAVAEHTGAEVAAHPLDLIA